MFQLSGLDAMFFHLETDEMPMHISSCTVYQQRPKAQARVEFSDVRELFENNLIKHVPVFKCKLHTLSLSLDQPYWVEDKHFCLDFHLRHIALPEPSDWKALRQLVAQMHARPLDRTKPLWEAYIIDGINHLEGVPKDSFALFLKVHHSIMDGRTGYNIMSSLLALGPNEATISVSQSVDDSLTASAGSQPYAEPGMIKKLSRAYANNLKKTYRLAGLLSKTLPLTVGKLKVAKYRKEITGLPVLEKTLFNQKVTAQRVVNRIHLPLADIKKIRKFVDGAKVNDVILTIVGGAMRRYLENKNAVPETGLVAGTPVDIRSEADDSVQGNLLTFMNTALCSDIKDPLERLRNVHRESLNAKLFTKTLGHRTLYDTLDSVYPGLISLAISSLVRSDLLDRVPPFANTIVSNIPSIPLPVYLAGAKLVDSFGMGTLLPNIGLFHVVSGVNDTITICFTACTDSMDDSDYYVLCLQESFQELRDATLGMEAAVG
jgi:WS/DGAT/MGAT family acyltransferase